MAVMLLHATFLRCEVACSGADQKQHIELARDIAERFNSKFGGKKWKKLGGRGGRLFKIPKPSCRPQAHASCPSRCACTPLAVRVMLCVSAGHSKCYLGFGIILHHAQKSDR